MEKAISIDERIRRAEERYYKSKEEMYCKNRVEPKMQKRDSHENKHSKKIISKFIKNIFVCLIIYGCFYNIKTNQYVFSEDFTNKAKEILNTDINFMQIYSNIKNNINDFIKNKMSEETVEENNCETQTVQENSSGEQTNQENNIQNNEENIGGGNEDTDIIENSDSQENNTSKETYNNTEETQELSEMEQDAKYVKENISVIKPVEGIISSKFGLRNPTTASVPKNHTGTDIAATTGTKIVSASDGKVILNSSEGDYGKHLKIQIGEVVFLYAHCNTLYVNEGDEIVQGQEIAEVGSTGNTTGPHLHFEIKYQDRLIDPEMVLEL